MRVNITIPVYNEEAALPVSIPKLCEFLTQGLRCMAGVRGFHATENSWEPVVMS